LLYRSSKYYGDGDPELRERISSANAKRNEIFEQLYDMSENKQELLDAMWRIVNGPLSDKKRPWYFEAAMLVENNIKLRKEWWGVAIFEAQSWEPQMPQELTIDEQLILAKKIEKALKDRTEQIQAALQQSQNELEAATAKREAIEAKLKDAGK
jgi:septal ring factor EnvC (AmiA/AmiB activator)